MPSSLSSRHLPTWRPPRKLERGVIKSLFLTLLFHVFALLFGVALLLLLGLTLGGVGLILLCICSGSSRSVRVLVANLWRAELWINSLGVDQAKRENAGNDARTDDFADRSRFEAMALAAADVDGSARNASTSRQGAASPQQQRGRVVTTSVMLLSLIYFLVFKWLFNIIFSTIPLMFWAIALAQVVPLDGGVTADLDVANGNVAKYFVAVAIGFLAHQIGVTAASCNVFISEKMTDFLFEEATRADNGDNSYAPLLHWNSGRGEIPTNAYQYHSALNSHSTFDARPYEERRPPMTSAQSMSAAHQSSFSNGNGKRVGDQQGFRDNHDEYTTNRRDADPLASRSADDRPSERSVQIDVVADRRLPPIPPLPPLPPIPPFDQAPPPPPALRDGSNQNNLEAAYRGQVEEKVVDCCIFKIHMKRVNDGSGRGGHGRGGHGERDHSENRGSGGSGRRGDFDRRGGGRSRGDLFGGRGGGGGRGALRDAAIGRYEDLFEGMHPRFNPHFRRAHSGDSGYNRHRDRCFPEIKLARPVPRTPDGGDQHRLKRRYSFDSMYAVTTTEYTVDGDQPPHLNMYEVLDLSPSAPSLHPGQSESLRRNRFSRSNQEYPLAQPADSRVDAFYPVARPVDPRFPPPGKLQFGKSNSDEGRYTQSQYQRDGSAQSTPHERSRGDQVREREDRVRMERDRILQDRDRVRQEQENLRAKQINQLQQQQAEKQREQAIRQVHQRERIQSLPELVDELDSAGRYAAKARPYDTSTHAQSAPGQIEAKEREDPKRSASARTSASTFSASGSRVIRRPLTSRGFSVARTIDTSMNDTRYEHQPDQRQISFTGPYTAGNEISDQEIRNHFGSIPRTFEEDGYLTSFGPADVLINPDNPLETISSLDDGRGGYRSVDGPSYTVFSPTNSLTSTNYGSFIAPGYDLLSPMNSIHDDDFPSDQLPQVYRSIRYSGPPTAAARITEFADQEARRDKVHFNAFAPPTVAPSPKPFHFTVWAFLLSQRDEMRERAETFDPDSSRLTVDTKLDIRRGALVHVTLEAPSGFRILNGATQGFSWGGKVCNATYDIECTEDAGFGQVMFKAMIIVGTEVAVLRSYVVVSSKKLDPADLEAEKLESKLEVLDMTFQEIPYSSLELKELVGKGYFGDAYRANYKGQDVVVKTIRASEFGETNDQVLREFQHEAAVLSMFGHHPCVVPFVGASTDIRFPLSVVTKYLPYGSLEDNLRDPNAGSKFSIRQKTLMLKDAAAGLLNIHEGGFIHRDIAARNCLVDDDLRVKICDFGLCRRVNSYSGALMKDAIGPVKYMAPESLQMPHLFSYKSDTYMFGVLMWETYTMSTPFASMAPIEAMLRVINGERLAVPTDLPDDLHSLMESCFKDAPAERPSMAAIMATLDASVSSTTSSKASAAVAAASASLVSSTTTRQPGRPIWV